MKRRLLIDDAALGRLGRRARERRLAVRISVAALARILGKSHVALGHWEVRLPRLLDDDVQLRWEQALQVPSGWLLSLQTATPTVTEPVTDPIGSADTLARCETVAEEIATVGWILATERWQVRETGTLRGRARRDYAEEIALDATLFAWRYGVSGPAQATLQAIGERCAITRERVRQRIEKLLPFGRGTVWALPQLAKLSSVIEGQLPTSLDELHVRCRQQLGRRLELDDVERFANEIVGKRLCAYEAVLMPGSTKPLWIREQADAKISRAMRDAAIAMIRSAGAAQLDVVAGVLLRQERQPFTFELLLHVLQSIPDFEWLAEADGWFWYGPHIPGRNRVLFVAERVLAAARRNVDAEEVAAAMVRSHREEAAYEDARTPSPLHAPLHVVEAILRRMPGVRNVQSDHFGWADKSAPEPIWSQSERSLLETFESLGGLASWKELRTALVLTRKMNPITLGVRLGNSPIIKPLTNGVYAIRGRRVAYTRLLEAFSQSDQSNLEDPFARYRFVPREAQRSSVQLPVRFRAFPSGEIEVEGATFVVKLRTSAAGVVTLAGINQVRQWLGTPYGQALELQFVSPTLVRFSIVD